MADNKHIKKIISRNKKDILLCITFLLILTYQQPCIYSAKQQVKQIEHRSSLLEERITNVVSGGGIDICIFHLMIPFKFFPI